MAAPAALLAVKAALAAASDKRVRTAAASVAAAVLAPFILIVVVILSMFSGMAGHNNSAVDLTFNGGYLSASLPADYRMHIEKMRESFRELDAVLSDIDAMSEGGTVDRLRVKSIFYSLFFGAEQPRMNNDDYRGFADCFVEYEERDNREQEYEEQENEERENEEEEIYVVAVPITDLGIVYTNLSALLGREITDEDKANAQRIYVLAKYGQAVPGDGLPPGEAMGNGSFAALIEEGEKYLGYPYVWGGSTPQTSFDCSGFVCWVYTHSGVYPLSRTTAAGIYNQCAIVPKGDAQPGDLVFFTGTYASSSPVSHVGIYVGGGQMLHCGSPIQYTSIETQYWQAHLYAFGRLLN